MNDLFLRINEDFYKVAAKLKVFSLAIMQKFDNPIFIMSFEDLNSDFPLLIAANEMGNEANYYVGYTEILKKQQLIKKMDLFMEHYKNPNAFCCLIFLDSQKENKVIYIPYEKKQDF